MSELRGIPRWSKTAVIVVLVVFCLVLAVSVFGLWALSESRIAADARLRSLAVKEAGKKLGALKTRARDELTQELQTAAKICDDGSALMSLMTRTEGALFTGGVEVDDQNVIHWIDGNTRLWMPQHKLDEEIRVGAANAKDTAKRAEAALAERRPAAALKRRLELAEWWPLVTFRAPGEPNSQPLAVQYAIEMLSLAIDSSGQGDGPEIADLRKALCRAVEIETFNQGRSDVAPEDLKRALQGLSEKVSELLELLPRAEPEFAHWEVEQLRVHRDDLANHVFRERVEAVVSAFRRGAQDETVLHADQGELMAAVGRGTQSNVVVFMLDAKQAARIIMRIADSMGFDDLGMDVRLVAEGTTPPDEVVVARSESLAMGQSWQMPYRVLLQQMRDPVTAPDSTTNWFYWGIIGLAIGGIGIGGYVLLRLLTREMRLAQLKADFVSNLSHELKTPITSISLFSEMLQDGKMRTQDERDEAYSVISAESERLRRIVGRMIEMARRAGGFEPGKQMMVGDLNGPVRQATARFRRIASEPGLHLHISLGPSPLSMRLDDEAMNDVVTNLLSNAWKYRRGDEANIHVITITRGRKVELIVEDDGVGISKGERKRIFEMFYRADQLLTHPVAGTGLGLALVRTIVRTHGGSIDVETGRGGVGTRFRLRFPLVTKASPSPLTQGGQTLDRVHNSAPQQAATRPAPPADSSGSRP